MVVKSDGVGKQGREQPQHRKDGELGIEKPPRVKQEGGLLGFPLVGTTGERAALHRS